MNKDAIARELIRVATLIELAHRERTAGALGGMSKRQAINFLYKLLEKGLRGFFSDEYWLPIMNVFKEFRDLDLDYELKKAEYGNSPSRRQITRDIPGAGMPDYKIWVFEIEFEDNRGKMVKIHGTITASGAGSIDDPLDRYDVTLNLN